MKLIYIYGPTASGKLTVARELSKITGFRLFHNHVVNDMLDNILDSKKESDLYWKVAEETKCRIIEMMAKENIKGLIFTMGYVKAKSNGKLMFNEKLPKKIKTVVEKNKGKVYLVKLECKKEELLKRVTNKSRKSFGKFSSVKRLNDFMRKYDLFGSLSFKNQLIINNTKISPKKVAQQIKLHYKL